MTDESRQHDLPPAESPESFGSARRVPAWAASFLLHLVLGLILGWTLRFEPAGAAVEPGRSVGIVLARESQGKREYFDEQSQPSDAAAARASNAAATADSALPEQQALPAELTGLLPAVAETLGDGTGDALPDPGEMTSGVGTSRDVGGEASTSIYGIPGKGNKFVYVFDRSGSMDGYQGRPLRSAKNELIGSLKDLSRTHQFQIIFYNERPRIFNPLGGKPQLVWGDEEGKTMARDFVLSIRADGGTRHIDALRLALNMAPDVIFFLTDADEPRMTPDELARIRRLNGNTSINAIEFGFGPSTGRDNFLKRLARDNNGQHAYVDISLLPR